MAAISTGEARESAVGARVSDGKIYDIWMPVRNVKFEYKA